MSRLMLIDALHEEETRVVITASDGQIDELDFASASRKQIKGNIYLAKVTRVEPSLQAAFVEYGGDKQGFLPFSEIHPDYYQIPVADKELLLAEEARLAAEEEARLAAEEAKEKEREKERSEKAAKEVDSRKSSEDIINSLTETIASQNIAESDAFIKSDIIRNIISSIQNIAEGKSPAAIGYDGESESKGGEAKRHGEMPARVEVAEEVITEEVIAAETGDDVEEEETAADADNIEADNDNETAGSSKGSKTRRNRRRRRFSRSRRNDNGGEAVSAMPEKDEDSGAGADGVETIDDEEEIDGSRVSSSPALLRKYKIQEVIKCGQIILVQVIKEERGNKGVSLTTYISLAGRYCVLMPNSQKAGGVSRKISGHEDRKRLKQLSNELQKSRGISVIIRTAGIDRTKAEIKRDYEYLIRLWNKVRETAISSTAPAQVHEEGDIIQRSIRDYYDSSIEKIWVQGEKGYKAAKAFMKTLMPSHAVKVKQFTDTTPIFYYYDVESQLQLMHKPKVKLKSGGSLDINPTEALISIDVNSGRSTTERNVEETALKTNLEAAVEVARQLRLRDLGGLVVIDFIDMYYGKHRRMVERAFKDALKADRAKIKVGGISPFGLIEMSRQRIRPSIVESASIPCPRCAGAGTIRSPESLSIEIIRVLERDASTKAYKLLRLTITSAQAAFMLNHSRKLLSSIEDTYGVKIEIRISEEIDGDKDYKLECILHNGNIEKSEGSKSRRKRARKSSKGGGGGTSDSSSSSGGKKGSSGAKGKRGAGGGSSKSRGRNSRASESNKQEHASKEEEVAAAATTTTTDITSDSATEERSVTDDNNSSSDNQDKAASPMTGIEEGKKDINNKKTDDDNAVSTEPDSSNIGESGEVTKGEGEEEAAANAKKPKRRGWWRRSRTEQVSSSE